ncbi:MAG: dUTP diphosphatase [bacterium]|nr:dUTP diphosphatase [bacterium]
MKAKIKLLSKEAKIPAYGRIGDAGLDLFCIEDYDLKPGERYTFKLGFAMELPAGTVAHVWDRSGMASKFGIHSLAGVIDSTYRGEVGVVLLNTAKDSYQIKKGDKIAQMVIQKFEATEFEQVDELADTERGEKGWFSSGK